MMKGGKGKEEKGKKEEKKGGNRTVNEEKGPREQATRDP
jgi:hypothetical protein